MTSTLHQSRILGLQSNSSRRYWSSGQTGHGVGNIQCHGMGVQVPLKVATFRLVPLRHPRHDGLFLVLSISLDGLGERLDGQSLLFRRRSMAKIRDGSEMMGHSSAHGLAWGCGATVTSRDDHRHIAGVVQSELVDNRLWETRRRSCTPSCLERRGGIFR